MPEPQVEPDKETDTSRPQWKLRLLAVACATILSLIVGEILCRVAGPAVYAGPRLWIFDENDEKQRFPYDAAVDYMMQFWTREKEGPGSYLPDHTRWLGKYDRPQWDYFDENGCVDYSTNGFGFRDHEFDLKKSSDDEYRILTIGDSMTFGMGIQLNDCWTEVLENRLRETLHPNCEVINGGFAAGYMIAHFKDWVLKRGFAFDPDVLLIAFCLNDLNLDIPMAILNQPCCDHWWGGRSRLLYLIQRSFVVWNHKVVPVKDYSPMLKDKLVFWKSNQETIVKLKQEADRKEVRVVVVILPMLTGLSGTYPFQGLHDLVRTFCQNQGIEVVDLLPAFRGRNERELWVHPVDQHPNHLGHRIIADALFDYLSD